MNTSLPAPPAHASPARPRAVAAVGVAAWAAALAAGVAPLWVARHLPLVDLPQHLHLVDVLRRAGDPATLYGAVFAPRHGFTPYLGYYEAVRALAVAMPPWAANAAFLSVYVAGLPLAAAFLLRGLGREAWPALLAVPFAYGDAFAWGFVGSCASWPAALVGLGAAARALSAPGRGAAPWRWLALLAASALAALLLHVVGLVFLLLGAAVLVLGTPPGAGAAAARRRARLAVLAALAPAGILLAVWVAGRLGAPAEVAPGQPWKAWGPALSARNLAFRGVARNAADLPRLLAGQLRDGSDALPALAAGLVAAAAFLARDPARRPAEGRLARARLPLLLGLALALYFALPFDVRGHVYALDTRFAQLAAVLAVACAPAVRPRLAPGFLAAAAAVGLLTGAVLGRGFRAFDREARALDVLAAATGDRPRIVGLVFDPWARTVTHPVFLHAAAALARERGGIANFSFASTPHSPVGFRGPPPPTFPSEWRPADFRYEAEGRSYDHFLLRGRTPAEVFGPRMGAELELAARADGFYLVRRR